MVQSGLSDGTALGLKEARCWTVLSNTSEKVLGRYEHLWTLQLAVLLPESPASRRWVA